MRIALLIFLYAGLSLTCTGALAQPPGFYLGGSGGWTSIKQDVGAVAIDESGAGYKIFTGGRLGVLGLEGGYVNFVRTEAGVLGTDVKATFDGWDLFGTAFVDLGSVALFAKAGAINWNFNASANGTSVDDSGSDFAYGLGASFSAGEHLSLRAEYEVFEAGDVDNLSMGSIGASWTF